MSTSSILCLDVLRTIMSYCLPCDYFNLQQVCRHWRHAARAIRPAYLESEDPVCRRLYLHSYVNGGIYPHLEDYLDGVHCVARAVSCRHEVACAYFLPRAVDLTVEEYASLFDLLGSFWSKPIFLLLVRSYMKRYRYCYHETLFDLIPPEHLEEVTFPRPKGRGPIKRAKILWIHGPPDTCVDLRLEAGDLSAIQEVQDPIWNVDRFSMQIRRLDQAEAILQLRGTYH